MPSKVGYYLQQFVKFSKKNPRGMIPMQLQSSAMPSSSSSSSFAKQQRRNQMKKATGVAGIVIIIILIGRILFGQPEIAVYPDRTTINDETTWMQKAKGSRVVIGGLFQNNGKQVEQMYELMKKTVSY